MVWRLEWSWATLGAERQMTLTYPSPGELDHSKKDQPHPFAGSSAKQFTLVTQMHFVKSPFELWSGTDSIGHWYLLNLLKIIRSLRDSEHFRSEDSLGEMTSHYSGCESSRNSCSVPGLTAWLSQMCTAVSGDWNAHQGTPLLPHDLFLSGRLVTFTGCPPLLVYLSPCFPSYKDTSYVRLRPMF